MSRKRKFADCRPVQVGHKIFKVITTPPKLNTSDSNSIDITLGKEKNAQNVTPIAQRPSKSWERCGDGFSDSSVMEISNVRLQTGTRLSRPEWIQPDCFPTKSLISSSSTQNREAIHPSLSSHQAETDTDAFTIFWNSSDSDSEDCVSSRIKIPSPRFVKKVKPVKNPKVCKKAKSFSLIKGNTDSDSDCNDLISASDSLDDDENDAEKNTPFFLLKESSPVDSIDFADSPLPQSSGLSDFSETATPTKEGVDNGHFLKSPPNKLEACETLTPSINSCTSSQTAPASDTSTSPGGMRASEWAKQMSFQNTPLKAQKPTSPQNEKDSAKKKKQRYVKDGLAQQLSRIIFRENSANHMWLHQQAVEENSSAKCLTVIVTQIGSIYSLHLAKCHIVHNAVDCDLIDSDCLVLFSRQQHHHQAPAVMKQGSAVKIFPPWQQLQVGGDRILLCARYLLITDSQQKYLHSQQEPLGEGEEFTSSGQWLCPCSTDAGKQPQDCPAHQFPFIPASIVVSTVPSLLGNSGGLKQTLRTVECSERMKPRLVTFDTLLESIEKAHIPDRVLPNFWATVLRIYHERVAETNIVRLLVLVEDSQGLVALISGMDSQLTKLGQDLEGLHCCFSGLRVQSRLNRDRDGALFSAVDVAWLERQSYLQSQDSGDLEPSQSKGNSEKSPQPPAFCYVLTYEDFRTSAVSMHATQVQEAITMDTSHTLAPSCLSTKAIACLMQCPGGRRYSVIAKVIYLSQISESSTMAGDKPQLYMFAVDHSLTDPGQTTSLGYIRVTINVDCMADCIVHKMKENLSLLSCLLLLVDLWYIGDTWIADKYTRLCELDENDRAQTFFRRVDAELAQKVKDCTVSLPLVSASSCVNSLVQVTGIIQGVDEQSAFSWDACDGCGSDQLGIKCATGAMVCMNCRKDVSSPVQRMKMDVYLLSDNDSTVVIKISLQQSTITNILPDEGDEEGYDIDCVLNNHVGPLNCFVTMATQTATGMLLTARQIAD